MMMMIADGRSKTRRRENFLLNNFDTLYQRHSIGLWSCGWSSGWMIMIIAIIHIVAAVQESILIMTTIKLYLSSPPSVSQSLKTGGSPEHWNGHINQLLPTITGLNCCKSSLHHHHREQLPISDQWLNYFIGGFNRKWSRAVTVRKYFLDF